MTIYGEYLFIENAAAGFIILMLAGRFAGRIPGKGRMAAGCILCGAYAFMLFAYIPGWLSIICDIIFSLMLTTIVYFPGFRRAEGVLLLRTCCIFYVVSFLAAGLTISLLGMLHTGALRSGTGVYTSDPTYLTVTAGLIVTYAVGSCLLHFMKKRAVLDSAVRRVELSVGGEIWKLNGIIDTGNTLKDPITGLPVSILSHRCGKKIMEQASMGDSDIFDVAFSSLGCRESVLPGFYADKMVLGDAVILDQVIAVGKDDLPEYGDGIAFDILLNQQTLEAIYE